MKEYLIGKRYNAELTPSLCRHWRFFVLGSTVYCLAALTLLRRPVPYAGINDQVFGAAGELLIRGIGYWLFGTVSFLLGCVPLMLLLIWEWMGFRYGLIPVVNLYGSGQYVQMCLLLMIRFGFVFFPCLWASIICWEETKAFWRKQRPFLLLLRIQGGTLLRLAATSFLAALVETLIL